MKKLKLVGMLAAVVMLMFIVVILNENEEIIEYLVYDRLSENEKCELYVLYRSKKIQMVHGIFQRRRSLIYLHIVCLQKMWSVVVKHHGQRLEVKSMK